VKMGLLVDRNEDKNFVGRLTNSDETIKTQGGRFVCHG
jgi:hypothetical protein